MKKRDEAGEVIHGAARPKLKVPLIVLINEQTKSGGEIIAAALRMSVRATTFGVPT
ncbi:MAG: hypothetical protein EOP10_14400 [Proteobacteria bacterium]|nr:MAG: hypothetical protein EOP10_14400 [Pseudomonadota bacterium]